MNPSCRVVLLGELSVQQEERRFTRFRTRKAGALFAFLAYHPNQAHPREELLERFWPHFDRDSARDNLSVALSSLRHQLEPPGVLSGSVLMADRHSVRLNAAAISTDVSDFEAGLRAVEEASEETQRVERLEEVVSLYGGPLLAGYYDDWIVSERQRLSDLHVNALRRLMRCLAAAGELPRALDYAQRAVSVDPLREVLHCDLMRLQVALGEVSLALRQYATLERALHQELGEKPSSAARELVREIKDRQRRAHPPSLPHPEERAATTTSEERGSLSEEATYHVFVRRTPATTTALHRGAEAPVVAPSGTATLLLAQTRNAPDSAEGSKIGVGTEAQASEPTTQAGGPSVTGTSVTVEGGATQSAARGSADAERQTLTRASALLRRELGRHRGYPFQRSRQGQGVAFQSVGEALSCAIAVQRNLGANRSGEGDNGPGVCIALHTGDIEPGAQEFRGRVLNQARRLLEAGHPGQILCSEAAASLLRRDLQPGERLTDLGLFRLRDVPIPEHIFEVEYPGKVPSVCPPLRAEAGYTARLPLPLTRFFGREEILNHLQALLCEERARLVTLTGAGGMGKTRLSIEAARRLVEAFGGAVWFVELADVDAGTGLLSALVDALGLPRSSPVEPLEQIRERLSQHRSLLVLDNFEHLVEREAATVGVLLERVPTLTCLVTSRQRLELGGEHEVVVPVLPVPEQGVGGRVWGAGEESGSLTGLRRPTPNPQGAKRDTRHPIPDTLLSVASVALFVDRAQAVKPDFQLTSANAEALAGLCMRLEGIPLAVELAASRVQVLTLGQIQSQLQNRFTFLVSRRRDVAARHRTLRAAIDWSYDLLSAELQQFFVRLAVFRGSFSLEAAEAVCAKELSLDYLAQLRECSLVVAEEEGETVRFRMLETLREYAEEKLAESGETAGVRNRHLAYFLGLAEKAEAHLKGAEETAWMDRLETEHDNLRAAQAWCQKSEGSEEIYLSSFYAEAGLRLVGALSKFWYVRGHLNEGRMRVARALEREDAQERTAMRAKALYVAGGLGITQGDYALARPMLEESLGIARELGDVPGIINSLCSLGRIAHLQGDYAAARALLDESLALSRGLGDRLAIVLQLTSLGRVSVAQGDLDAARKLLEESLALSRELNDGHTISDTLIGLGNIACMQGDYTLARARLEESRSLLRDAGNRRGVAFALGSLSQVAFLQGDITAARTMLEEALLIFREAGDRRGIANALTSLGHAVFTQGDYASARAMAEETLILLRELNDRKGIAENLVGMAALCLEQGDARKGVLLRGASDALRDRIGSPVPPHMQEEHARQAAQARAVLGEEALVVAWEAGRALTMEQAIEYALENTG